MTKDGRRAFAVAACLRQARRALVLKESAWCRGRAGTGADRQRSVLPEDDAQPPDCDDPPGRRRLCRRLGAGQAQMPPGAVVAAMAPPPEGQAAMKSASTAAVPLAHRPRSAASKALMTAGSRPVAP
jgi:hypothetical protein